MGIKFVCKGINTWVEAQKITTTKSWTTEYDGRLLLEADPDEYVKLKLILGNRIQKEVDSQKLS